MHSPSRLMTRPLNRTPRPGAQVAEPADPQGAMRWDHHRVLFDINVGGDAVACAISRLALEVLGDSRVYKAGDLLRCFVRQQALIEGLAQAKFLARPPPPGGRLHLWADDMPDPPRHAPGSAAALLG